MVQRRPNQGSNAVVAKNPFDSDDESSPRYRKNRASSSYSNPFDDDHEEKPANKLDQQNPFDDDTMWKKNSSSTKPQKQQNIPRPRSKNLMGGAGTQNRKLLLGDQDEHHGLSGTGKFRNEQTKLDHERIDRAMKEGYSLDGESVQELESYGLQKAEETTTSVYKALKLAEEIKEGATNTVIQLHQQGEQIRNTHETAVNIDHELSRGEKLLGSLGGLFSKTWKPKKGRNITGPVITRGDSFKRKAYGMEQRNALGLGKNRASTSPESSEGSQFQSRVQKEFAKQDDALSDLSNVIGQLKEMSMDMGAEIGRQTQDLDHLELDVTELEVRTKGANERARRLLGR